MPTLSEDKLCKNLIDRNINFQINLKNKEYKNLKVNNKCNSEGGDCVLIA